MSRTLRVLILEDSPTDAQLLIDALREADFEPVAQIVDGERDFLAGLKASPDVILCDYFLPTFDGLHALHALRERQSEIPLIVISGHMGEETVLSALREGAADYLLKDGLGRIGPVVSRVLEHSRLRAEQRRTAQLLQEHQEVTRRILDTEPNRLANELRVLEDRFQKFFEIASVGIGQVDPRTGKMLLFNDKMCEITGYSRQELLDKSVQELTHPDDREADWALYQRAVRGEIPQYINEMRYVRKDGIVVWGRVNAAFIRDPSGEAILTMAVVEDITERKRAEDQVQQLQKLEAIGQLAGGVAHDFNNLLTIISGYGELVLQLMREEDPLREFLLEILRAARGGAQLTRKLLEFSGKQVLKPVILDLNALLRDMENMLSRLIGEDIDFALRLSTVVWPVRADPSQFEQAVMNLVVNARDAMPQGGCLTIETLNIVIDDEYATLHPEAVPGDYVLVAISDTGCGIAKEALPHIFEPFYTTKAPDKGTGLGLSTVQGIVKQCSGRIVVYSEPNLGTTFKLYVPRELESQSSGRVQAAVTDGALSGCETVLLVEDDEAVRSMVRILLKTYGYTVLEARHGVEAQRQSEQYPGRIDLLVTDVVMPNVSGRQLAERLAPVRPGMKVLYLSGYMDDAILRHGILADNVPLLKKPFSFQAFLHKVREALEASPER